MRALRLAVVVSAIVVSACADPSGLRAPVLPPSEVLSRLVVNIPSAIVAVDDSLDLSMVALSATDDTIPVMGGSTPEWYVSDPSRLRVSQSGRVIALKASNDDVVSAGVRWTLNGVTRTDAAHLVITATRLPVARIQIWARGDSTRTSFFNNGSCCGVYIVARNAAGDSVGLLRAPLTTDPSYSASQVMISYLGSIGPLIGLAQYYVSTRIIGPYWLYAQSLVYGTPMRDSTQFTGLYPPEAVVTFTQDSGSVQIESLSHGNTNTMQPCGALRFTNKTAVPIDITFDDPAKASGCRSADSTGNIENLLPGKNADRKFPVVGTAVWTARARDAGPGGAALSGTVIMREP